MALGLSCLLILTGCDQQKDTSDGTLTFAVMGDVPYGLTPEEMKAEDEILKVQIQELNQNKDLAFVMHVGDIKKGAPPCNTAVFEKVDNILRASTHPLFIIPGDNEWNDCTDPAEAWKLWEQHFMRFDEHWPNQLGVERQPEREENFAFTQEGILFAGLNMVGGRVHDWQEWETRIGQDRRWLETQFKAHASDTRAAVIFVHANPGKLVEGKFEYNIHAFRPLIEYLDTGTQTDYPKPILFIHGDGHKWIEDHPFP
ncbi:MAG: hypothetical protein KJT03_17105, partial [Verrucomicrobiae bacterium]|nr:hypothetical protein [Verrucomicrobiae bacterium]